VARKPRNVVRDPEIAIPIRLGEAAIARIRQPAEHKSSAGCELAALPPRLSIGAQARL
jgi:hypothetical protein